MRRLVQLNIMHKFYFCKTWDTRRSRQKQCPVLRFFVFVSKFMPVPTTPTKPVKRGRKPNPDSPNDHCRFCQFSLKSKFGNFNQTSYISTENIFRRSEKEDSKGFLLSELYKSLGVSVVRSSTLSDRMIWMRCWFPHNVLSIIRYIITYCNTIIAFLANQNFPSVSGRRYQECGVFPLGGLSTIALLPMLDGAILGPVITLIAWTRPGNWPAGPGVEP